jgi:hypothetical protein
MIESESKDKRNLSVEKIMELPMPNIGTTHCGQQKGVFWGAASVSVVVNGMLGHSTKSTAKRRKQSPACTHQFCAASRVMFTSPNLDC